MSTYSVIIPVYNCGAYLKECVSSIIHQNGIIQYEVILVDDGSIDDSGTIADELAKHYSNVQTFHKQNGGAASARNIGIEKASGDYLLFIDGDDTIDEKSFEIIHSALKEDPDMIVFGMSFDYYLKGNVQRQEILSCKHFGLLHKESIFNNYKDLFYDNVFSSACNKVFRRDLVEKYRLRFNEEMTLYEDYDFVLQFMEYIDSFCLIDHPLYHYRHDIEHPHVRVIDMNRLKQNQVHLMDTVIRTTEAVDHKGIYEVTCNVYMDLLVSHLMNRNYTGEDLEKVLPDYVQEYHFQKMLKVACLTDSNQRLYQDIQSGNFGKIEKELKKRKSIAKKKQFVKKLLRKT